MKRLKSLLFSCMISCVSFAQTIWKCPQYDSDLAKFNGITNKYKPRGDKTWSKVLLESFPLTNEGTIQYQYVITSDKSFNVTDISEKLLAWYKIKMPTLDPKTGSPEHLTGIAVLQSVGRAVGYMNATFINAREEVSVDIKENKVRVTVSILGFISSNTWAGVELMTPINCYPANPKGAQKDSHAMAFINSHYDAISVVGNIMKYLNDNTKQISDGDDDW